MVSMQEQPQTSLFSTKFSSQFLNENKDRLFPSDFRGLRFTENGEEDHETCRYLNNSSAPNLC